MIKKVKGLSVENNYSDKKIKKGEKVEVIDVDGLTLKVKKHERR